MKTKKVKNAPQAALDALMELLDKRYDPEIRLSAANAIFSLAKL